MLQKDGPKISGCAFVKKLSPSKKVFLKKEFFGLICADKIFNTVSGNFFKISGSRDILNFRVLQFRKLFFKEGQGNSAHRFEDKYLTKSSRKISARQD